MLLSSVIFVVVFSVVVVVVCFIGGVVGFLWFWLVGWFRGGCYFVFMGVVWVLLVISVIVNVVKGLLWWDIWSFGLLVFIFVVVYGKMCRSCWISFD